MRNLAILHFNPLEQYPPVQNFIQLLERNTSNYKIFIFTTISVFKELDKFNVTNSNIKIIRLGKSGHSLNRFHRIWTYFLFYFGSVFYMFRIIPKSILFYETLSVLPAFIYKKIFKSSVRIFIHYHEYTSNEECSNGTMLMKFFRHLEKSLYPAAEWISHTNDYRMKNFEKNIRPIIINKKKILPNYPPHNWSAMPKEVIHKPVKIVYVGAVSLNTMYTKEFANWVIEQDGNAIWDIYSYNIDEVAQNFFNASKSDSIRLKKGVNYYELPPILRQYDVGVILYTGHISNYIYNAPNKLFEYKACGLDVWFPLVMVGSLPYITGKVYPKVLALDFTNLKNFNLDEAIERKEYTLHPASFNCEEVFRDLANCLLV